MPELPEVETVRRGLEARVRGFIITNVVVAVPKVLRGQSQETLAARVTGTQIAQIERRGKYLLVRLDAPGGSPEPLRLVIHLKMRGQIAVEAAESEPAKYHCVTLDVQEPSTGTRLAVRFYDAWGWGEVRALYESEMDQVPSLARMGQEPLSREWTARSLADAVRGKRTAIKPTLLDQTVVAGIGNIYADEALYRARLHPKRVAGTLTPDEIERLADAIKTVLTEAVGTGGTTSENFADVAGDAGRYVPQVYERGGKPCPVCGQVLTRIRLAGRSAVFCDTCQPEANDFVGGDTVPAAI